MAQGVAERIFEVAVGQPDADGGLNDAARGREPANFLRHVAAVSSSKVADGLLDPKLVLSWLLTHLGAGPLWAGLLVPVREAGALLPQLFTAGAIHGMARRKWAWAAGSAGQGLAAAGIVLSGLALDGPAAGAAIVSLLAVLALCRSVCSVAYKDVLGKTVGKSRRGTATGMASSASASAVLCFALLLLTGVGERATVVLGAVALASAAWLVAASVFSTMNEEPDAQEAMSLRESVAQLSILRESAQLRRFIVARSLLVGTALAPPFLVVLGSDSGILVPLGRWCWPLRARLSPRPSSGGGCRTGPRARSWSSPGWAGRWRWRRPLVRGGWAWRRIRW
ncbi:hypothetical protein ROA7023_02074 [Roseisalinus antarcticus]|uniref:Major Facilitator Superfamily protein n=1 Tax=Roseisalinus antarcticus TaxID=254357 RepID=A0A1Y5SUL1_9RHOB|nr:hypothetical protein ROA7023_02074 [Roseisalinus antarcticus]